MKPTTSPFIEVRRSVIHAQGIFAACDIPKGTKIREDVGDKITKKESDQRADEQIERHQENPEEDGSVYIFTLDNKYDIDGNVEWNTARLINHSCQTNCESDIIDGKIYIIAQKDIKKGQELAYDYGYSLEDFESHPCRCGSRNCCGYIVAERFRKKLKKKLKYKKNKR